jgi:hypothetical protein
MRTRSRAKPAGCNCASHHVGGLDSKLGLEFPDFVALRIRKQLECPVRYSDHYVHDGMGSVHTPFMHMSYVLQGAVWELHTWPVASIGSQVPVVLESR